MSQLLYAFGAALCVISNYWALGFILLMQLNYAMRPAISVALVIAEPKGQSNLAYPGCSACPQYFAVFLFQMFGEILVHLEHGDGLLAENGFEFVVRQDLALVGRVLQLVLLDVGPDLADNIRARQRLGADNGREFLGGCQRFVEGAAGGRVVFFAAGALALVAVFLGALGIALSPIESYAGL